MSDSAAPKTTPLKLTRGAAYLLEGILQDPRPCDTPDKIVKWSRLYGAIRRANDRTITVRGVKYDIEKARNKIILGFGMVEDADKAKIRDREVAVIEFEETTEAWRQEIVEVAFTKKNLDTAKAAVEYRVRNQDLAKGITMPINEHSFNLLVELGLDDAE